MERIELPAASEIKGTRVDTGAHKRRMSALATIFCMQAVLAGCFWVPEQIKAIEREPVGSTDLANQMSFVTTPDLLSEIDAVEDERARVDAPGGNRLTLVSEVSDSDS